MSEQTKNEKSMCPLAMLIPVINEDWDIKGNVDCCENKCEWWIEQPLNKGCAIKVLAMRLINNK